MNENNEKQYFDGTVTKLVLKTSKAGNPVLNATVTCDDGETRYAMVALLPELTHKNLPTLRRLTGVEFEEGSPAEIMGLGEFTQQRVTLVIHDIGRQFPNVYVNDPRKLKLFDNREDSDMF